MSSPDNSVLTYLKPRLHLEIDDMRLALEHLWRMKRRGHFWIAQACFTFCEHLGMVATDRCGSGAAVYFIGQYLGTIDERYFAYSSLLYNMFRHGLVHERSPKYLCFAPADLIDDINHEFYVGWVISIHNRRLERDQHLKCVLDVTRSNRFGLCLNLPQFIDDLEAGLLVLHSQLRCSHDRLTIAQSAYDKLRTPQGAFEERFATLQNLPKACVPRMACSLLRSCRYEILGGNVAPLHQDRLQPWQKVLK